MLIILLLAGSLVLVASGMAQANTYSVAIKKTAFNPKELTISAGDTVTWTNYDAMSHDVDFESMGKSPVLSKGQTYSKTFGTPGTYNYDCDIHPFMKGTVIVQ